jgi:hypothetical protein
MTSKRLLMTVALLAMLLWAAPVVASDFGGVPAQPFGQGAGGGVAAPVAPDDAETTAPEAEAAQEDTPTTPEGEEQPDGEEPPTGTDTVPEEEPDLPPPGDEGGTGGGSGGSLPTTGLEVAALAMIGLGLLMAGLALRPTSSWPPPRGRLSRSTTRR